jgi:hypothetical protein
LPDICGDIFQSGEQVVLGQPVMEQLVVHGFPFWFPPIA